MSVLSRQKNESSSREDPQLHSGLCINSSTSDTGQGEVGNNRTFPPPHFIQI